MVTFGKKSAALRLFSIVLFTVFLNCQSVFSQVNETTQPLLFDRSQTTIRSRFSPPKGFFWVKEKSGSFSEYLVNFPLHPPGFPIRDYRGVPIRKQDSHVAILKIDVGDKDLQQCADAWMRLYAEYLWARKRSDEVGFQFTSGQYFSWNDYKKGIRTREYKNRVRFFNTGYEDDSYFNFRSYLSVIFRYAGTISLDRESVPVLKTADIQTGDFLIKPGSPGHSVIVVGVAANAAGRRLFLLAESFMPAQDVHILKNPASAALSPWYDLNVDAPQTVTAKYIFKPTRIKRFHALATKEKETP